MANHKSSARQAIKDMMELGIDVSYFTGLITEFHRLNAEISIVTKEKVKRSRKTEQTYVPDYTPKAVPQPKHVYNRRIIINVDGTVSVEFTEWDYK